MRLENINELIEHYDRLYASLDSSDIPDSVYDSLVAMRDRRLKSSLDDEVLLQKWKPVRGKRSHHNEPMRSVNRVYLLDAILKKIPVSKTYSVEPKYDGIAFSAIYKSGLLTIVRTRGDGLQGEDITSIILERNVLPLKLKKDVVDLEVRGEFFLTNKDYKKLNTHMKKCKLEPYKTIQHAASASCVDVTIPSTVSHIVYGFSGELPDKVICLSDFYKFVKRNGLKPVESYTAKAEEVADIVEHIRDGKINFYAPLDGVLIKLSSIEEQREVGATLRKPRWSVAYKFPSESKTSKILSLKHTVSLDGEIVPLADIEPVVINGITAKSPTLYNYAVMKALNYNIGKVVTIELTGGTVVTIKPKEGSKKVKAPKPPARCPCCNRKTIMRKEKVYCSSPEICSGTTLKRFVRFFGRSGLDVKNLGPSMLEVFIKDFKLKQPEDLFTISPSKFASYNGGTTIYDNLQSSIFVNKRQLLMALYIPGLGVVTAEKINEEFKGVSLLNVIPKLKTMDKALHAWLTSTNVKRLERLYSIGFENI